MPSDVRAIAGQLTRDLVRDVLPVQISHPESVPAGVPEYLGEDPSVRAFFAFGIERPFYASLPKHEVCEVRASVLGIPLTSKPTSGSTRWWSGPEATSLACFAHKLDRIVRAKALVAGEDTARKRSAPHPNRPPAS